MGNSISVAEKKLKIEKYIILFIIFIYLHFSLYKKKKVAELKVQI